MMGRKGIIKKNVLHNSKIITILVRKLAHIDKQKVIKIFLIIFCLHKQYLASCEIVCGQLISLQIEKYSWIVILLIFSTISIFSSIFYRKNINVLFMFSLKLFLNYIAIECQVQYHESLKVKSRCGWDRAGGVAQRQSTCLASIRPWVQNPVPFSLP